MVDVPVGTGRVLHYLRDLDVRVAGVDITLEMLGTARKNASLDKHTLKLANAAKLPFEDGRFDCLSSLRFFHLFPVQDRQQFADEFSRVIRPGGYIIVSFTNGMYAGGWNWLKRMLGFKTVFFEYPGEVKRLFAGWSIERLEGNFLPKQWWLDSLPAIGGVLRRLTQVTPLNRLCWERFYLLRKPLDG